MTRQSRPSLGADSVILQAVTVGHLSQRPRRRMQRASSMNKSGSQANNGPAAFTRSDQVEQRGQ
jgi:hypothetical protein